ncbi:MAG: acyl carrier protein [Luteibacter sp.]|uniref:acyl carrier protein n=1 Tax=Luteibacter TaxID=242605 RepID=UPI000559D97F|nr:MULTISPECIES: acyl carrier protein [unclassified Luteibacter]MDQ7997226.1 acyl carrier protein [Luteibacter sp.]MDQ8049432.1 acyl carrier protein [Luteibacter sp.]
MNHQDIVAKLVDILEPLAEGRVADIGENTELTGELALDSLRVMDLVLAVEDEFDISIPINALAEIKTVGDLAAQIETTLSANA